MCISKPTKKSALSARRGSIPREMDFAIRMYKIVEFTEETIA